MPVPSPGEGRGGGGADRRGAGRFGVKPDLVPVGEQSAAGLLEDWPPYDPVFDPINRVFLPRADIATDTLVAGLVELGWEVDDVTAYRTVRAAPPPAGDPRGDQGGWLRRRSLHVVVHCAEPCGDRGQASSRDRVACIGPATAKTAEEHGLRVDVMAPEPSHDKLAEALADFGVASGGLLLWSRGDPVTRPSERRPGARRRRDHLGVGWGGRWGWVFRPRRPYPSHPVPGGCARTPAVGPESAGRAGGAGPGLQERRGGWVGKKARLKGPCPQAPGGLRCRAWA